MSSNKYCVIMAGGIGTRFWPKSRQSMPKQFLDILGTGKSFIRHTYERFAKMVPAENFLVVTNDKYKSLVLEHIPEILHAAETQSRCRNDRHPGGSPDPQRRRLPGDHRRVSRLRLGARRADDRGHQTHASRHGLRLHPGLGRQAHQQGQVLHREARHRTGAGVPAIR